MMHDVLEAPQAEKRAAATQDPQWRTVDRTMRAHGNHPEALIETLHVVQNTFGYIDESAMEYVAHGLHVPLSQVYAVVTFYHSFTLKPPGEHTCVICTGTACYIGGSTSLLDAIHEYAGIAPGETTQDGKVSLLTARCLGSCGLAPAGVFDGTVNGKLQPSEVVQQLKKWGIDDADT